MIGTLVLALVVQWTWAWDWRLSPVPGYQSSKLSITDQKSQAAQKLWDRIFVSGLPEDHVASVVVLGKKPQGRSDFWKLDDAGNIGDTGRWMNPAHVQRIAHHYPSNALWHGQADELRKPLPDAMRSSAQPLQLLVHQMKRVYSIQLREALVGRHQVVVQPGRRLQFSRSKNSAIGTYNFDCKLLNRQPSMMPMPTAQDRRHPPANLIVVVSSPKLNEARMTHEDRTSGAWSYGRTDQFLNFAVLPPQPYIDIAGVTVDEWIDGSTIDIWWPEELGIVDLELSSEQVR
jgi:hypothetical protein